MPEIHAPQAPTAPPGALSLHSVPEMNGSSLPTGRRADIQGLRGLSVLLVVLYHAGLPLLPGGYVGVDVFFVISGYLISGLIFEEFQKTGSLDLVQFYARRARRLLPAASLLVLTVVAISWLLYPPLERAGLNAAAATTTLYVSNIWFARQATDYFATGQAVNPLLHTWSLGVEEQFYFVWPLLFLVAARLGARGRLRERLCLVAATTTALSLVACVALTHSSQPWAFFGSPTRAWEFGIGALVRLVALPYVGGLKRSIEIAGWLGASLMIGSALMLSDRTPFPGVAALCPAFGAAICLKVGDSAPDSWVPRALSRRFWTYFGDVSYAWYLWHWPVFVLLEWEYGPLGAGLAVTGLVTSLLAAEAAYRVVEEPLRHNAWLWQRPRTSLALGATLSAFVLLVTAGMQAAASRDPRVDSLAVFAAAQGDHAIIYDTGCHADYGATRSPPCQFGSTDSDRTIVLFGDSHAAHWFPAVQAIANEQRWQVISLTKSSCPSVDVSVILPQFNRQYEECDAWRLHALTRILEMRPVLVVLANSSRYVEANSERSAFGITAADWESGVRRTLHSLDHAGIPVALIHDTPWADAVLPTCLARAQWRGRNASQECAFQTADPDRALQKSIEEESLKAQSWGRGLDLVQAICPEDPCQPTQEGTVIFADSNHLTASFSTSLAPALQRALLEALPDLPWSALARPSQVRRGI